MIISVEELKNRIGEKDLVVVDCFYNDHEYRRGHIPTAIRRQGHSYVKSGTMENPGKHYPDPAEFEKLMNDMGIGPNTTVVAYDADGSLFATRFLWGLMYYGHNNVLLLNGGWQAWIKAGYQVSTSIHEPRTETEEFKTQIYHGLVISMTDLVSKLKRKDTRIIDVRRLEEYLGDDNRGNIRAGRIPGSVHIEWTDLMSSPNTVEELSIIKQGIEIEQIMQDNNVSKKHEVVTYCQGGVRASLVAYLLIYLGYPNVRLYDGSMYEWANEKETPLVIE